MRRPLMLVALVAASAVALASLYLPWRQSTCDTQSVPSYFSASGASLGLPNLFASCALPDEVKGWSSVGDIVALSALLLALIGTGTLVWPRFHDRWPVTPSLLLVYFLLAVGAQTRAQSRLYVRESKLGGGSTGVAHFHLAYGAYAGFAAGVLTLLGTGLARPGLLSLRPPLRRLCAAALGTGVLALLLLPWWEQVVPSSSRFGGLGVAEPAGAIAAVFAVRLLVVSCGKAEMGSLELGGLAVGVLIFAAASFTVQFGDARTWESWAGVVIAGVLTLVVLADRSLARRLRPVPLSAGATAAAGVALVTSFFLPWQKECFGNTSDFRRFGIAGRCVSQNGFSEVGSAAAVLALVLVAVVVTTVMRPRSTIGLAVAVGLFVTTLGFGVETGSFAGEQFSFGDGSFVGFAAAGSLVALVLLDMTRPPWDLREILPNLVPIILAAGFVFVTVVPWWDVLPDAVGSVLIPDPSWLTLAGAVVAVCIVDLWARQTQRVSDHASDLVALSVALVVLAVLEDAPFVRLTWHDGLLLGISVPLALLAIAESRGGLRNPRVPEILRVDRI